MERWHGSRLVSSYIITIITFISLLLAPMKTESMGILYSTKNSEIFLAGTNGAEISWERLYKIPEILNFRKANH